METEKYKFMREELEDTYKIKKLQDKILEIMVYIDEFCSKHNIKYFLMGGSALGAIRHNGFIPWDDDLDIFMKSKDYFRFIELCKEELDGKKFYLQQENTKELPYFFSKIRMNGTTCIESVNKTTNNLHQGIFIDVMCLNNSAKTRLGKKLQYYSAGLLKARAVSKTNYETKSKLKKIQLVFSKIFVNGCIKKLLLWLVRKNNKKETIEVAHLFGRAKFENSFYEASWFSEQRYVPFENVKLAVPREVEEYLTKRYGASFMQMPDEKTKAIYTSHAMIWDTEKDYKEYLK